jgi:hypothetical protein
VFLIIQYNIVCPSLLFKVFCLLKSVKEMQHFKSINFFTFTSQAKNKYINYYLNKEEIINQILQQYIMEFDQKHLLLLYLLHYQLKVELIQKNQMMQHNVKGFVFHVCYVILKSLIILLGNILKMRHQLNYEILVLEQTFLEFFSNQTSYFNVVIIINRGHEMKNITIRSVFLFQIYSLINQIFNQLNLI